MYILSLRSGCLAQWQSAVLGSPAAQGAAPLRPPGTENTREAPFFIEVEMEDRYRKKKKPAHPICLRRPSCLPGVTQHFFALA
eukprot:gene5043-3632_t